MASVSGTITNNSGWLTLHASLRDSITFTPTGTYSVEYPTGTIHTSAGSSAQTIGMSAGGQIRFTCITGTLAYALTDRDDQLELTASQVAAARALLSESGIAAKTWEASAPRVLQQTTPPASS